MIAAVAALAAPGIAFYNKKAFCSSLEDNCIFIFFSIARVHSDLIVPWTLLMHVMTAMRPIADDQDLHESLF